MRSKRVVVLYHFTVLIPFLYLAIVLFYLVIKLLCFVLSTLNVMVSVELNVLDPWERVILKHQLFIIDRKWFDPY